MREGETERTGVSEASGVMEEERVGVGVRVGVGEGVGTDDGAVGRKRAAKTPVRIPKRIRAITAKKVLRKEELLLGLGLVWGDDGASWGDVGWLGKEIDSSGRDWGWETGFI